MTTIVTTLWIACGGALGTVARYWLAIWAISVSRTLPMGTIGINVAGSLLIGFFGTLTLAGGRHPLPETARLFVMIGFCGGFTTFSSFSLQTLDLLRGDAWGRALLNDAKHAMPAFGDHGGTRPDVFARDWIMKSFLNLR